MRWQIRRWSCATRMERFSPRITTGRITRAAAELAAAGLAPTNNRESAIAATLPPGLYTALLAGLNNGTGIGLVEVYDRGAMP